jgi:sigma-B regulation protein RsbU (phosphoserine phosphatase)
MHLRKLYHTIEQFASIDYKHDVELLSHVLKNIVRNEDIQIKGGRLWKFDARKGAYCLIAQVGEIDRVRNNFELNALDYPMFLDLVNKRTILATETNKYLRRKGIHKYSATGIGEVAKWKKHSVFPYVLAFNSEYINETMLQTMNVIGSSLTSILQKRKNERKAKEFERDLDQARIIQRRILPEHECKFHHYNLYGISIADRVVGGDFFDYVQSDESDRLAIMIGDAASKGLSAAAQALYTSGALRMGIVHQTKISVLLSRTNKLLHKTFADERFVSLFFGELTNDKNGLLVYANAGHNNPILLHSHHQKIEFLETTSQVLGPFPEAHFQTESTLIHPNDILLLYTDGIIDATNDDGKFYGESRLVEKLFELQKCSAKEICQLTIEDVEKFSANGSASDDKTIVVVKRET